MVFAADGTLYGTTYDGGGHQCNDISCGTVFKLSPPATACKSALCPWDETVVYRFLGNPQAGNPNGGPLVFDQQGNLYGAANWGPTGYGTVYELSDNGGTWSETISLAPITVLHGVVADNAGNLYGANRVNNLTAVAESISWSTPAPAGTSIQSLLAHRLSHPGRRHVRRPHSRQRAGNLYGSTAADGPNGGGTVFELSAGTWNFNLLYGFSGGGGPEESLSMDSAGNLYGTATYDEGAFGYGSVFELTPSANGWIYTDLYDFTGGNDGRKPISNVVIDAHGNLYGTATRGGSGPCTNITTVTVAAWYGRSRRKAVTSGQLSVGRPIPE